jgi:hypothetical protein
MTERKTDVLNIRVDAALAAEIDRIATWRQTTASEVARDLIKLGIQVERQLEAQELKQSYGKSTIDRNPGEGYLKIDAGWVWYTLRELAERQEAENEARELHDQGLI